MKDIKCNKKCIICYEIKSEYYFYSNYDMCAKCLKELRIFKNNISSVVRSSLKYGTESYIWKFLPYRASDLKLHLEKQFEPWMNWNNRGIYKYSAWNDNDPKTWTWQLDHIVPQAAFLFTSVRDDSFKICWSLNNLRPLSSKNNIFKNRKVIL